jgi:hypothetical protein
MVIVRVSQYAGIFPLMAFPSLNAIPGTFRILSTELYASLYRGVVQKKPPPPPPPNPHLLYLYPLPSIADTESGDFLAPGSGQQHWLYLYPAFLSNVQVNG